MLKIGPYTISAVETGSFGLDGGAMFGIVPKPLWKKTNPADEANRIDMRLRAMLIQKPKDESGPARNIIVDCGIGYKWAEKHQKIYKIDHSKLSLEAGLQQKNLTREDITDVILTHLHFDHAGGLTRFLKEGDPKSEIIPTFPNAQVYLQKRNWDLAWHPSEKDRASYLTENYAPYADAKSSARKLCLLDTQAIDPSGVMKFNGPNSKEEEILPGISVEVSNGHTLGMQIVRVSGAKWSDPKSIVYCADLIPTATHVRIPFIMGYDCFPMFILEEKKKLLNRVVDEQGYLFYEHCPHMAASSVIKTKKGDFEHGKPLTL